ncbi:hypothetical protein BBJ28_00010845 [Nothophytophthora sp. Chile5]|nr:hypothetical protein BBJ28_00010845 [Nothophytophthora sp. Chile5]
MPNEEECGVASYALPPSPARSPTGSDHMSVWVEDADGEQRVHMALHSPTNSSVTDSSVPQPLASSSEVMSTALTVPGNAMDFPLVLCASSDVPTDHLPRTSSAIVPFQKLQLDTNLNQTMLPYKVGDGSPRSIGSSNSSSIGSPASSGGGSESSVQRKTTAQQLASSFLGMESESSTRMSQDFMNALRLGDLGPQGEPQLSVRLRGHRVELASASEEEHVDFLGPAENIKRLFKLPYSQSRVSLAVHRVGSTLVVDGELEESDLPAGFEDLPQETLQLQQSEDVTQSLLYEKFIYESTVKSQLPPPNAAVDTVATECQPTRKSKTKKHKKQKKHKKVAQKTATSEAAALEPPPDASNSCLESMPPAPQPWIGNAAAPKLESVESKQEVHVSATPLPGNPHSSSTTASDQDKATSSPFSPTESNSFASATRHSSAYGASPAFQRILKWKFHDLKMILGSQVLLFSSPEHPAVSLKLHDMDTELSLCTVLDYYLDNVIANIPELAICMHSKGFVRGYKLVETRQIPYMSGTGRPLFDIQDVSMNASMLLKFLQENCSRPNGTYWLHRKEGESSLRLYDVDVLSQGKQLKWKYMMAMLCYRFAARASRLVNSLASATPHLQQQLQQRQRDLLRTCMNLLGEIAEKGGTAHNSICSSVSEQLADTYLRECDQFHTGNPLESGDTEREAAVQSLEKAKQYLLASIRSFEECIPRESSPALPHSDDGANEDDEDVNEDGEGEMGSFMDDELNRLQLKFSSACLELGHVYFASHKWGNAVDCVVEACGFLPLSSIPDDVKPLESYSDQWKAIDELLDTLDFDGVGRIGRSPNKVVICTSGAELRCCLLGLIGDMAAQNPSEVYHGLAALYEAISGVKRELLQLFKDEPTAWTKFEEGTDGSSDETPPTKEEELMILSFRAYLRALSPPVDSELYFLLMKKLGNASNELGKYFLAAKRDYEEASRWFERGCKIFNDIEDGINVALLQANLAHLHKIFAQGKAASSREQHYRTAIQLCTAALEHLKQSKADLELHRKVKGELALSYLVWAVDMASNNSSLDGKPSVKTGKSLENETLKTFNRALSLYAELGDHKQVASTHYQIASYFNRMISRMFASDQPVSGKENSDGSLKNRMEIARRHYEKALAYFGQVEVGKTFVLIHQELADLHALGGRLEGIEHALLILLSTFEAFNRTAESDSTLEKETMSALARDIVGKVKLLLHQLIRLSSTGRAGTGNSHTKSKKLAMFKKMYKEVIYYDGYSAGSIVPILGTLRAMYLL